MVMNLGKFIDHTVKDGIINNQNLIKLGNMFYNQIVPE